MQPAGGDFLKSSPRICEMRSFVHFQFVSLRALTISAPLHRVASNISALLDSVIVVSSVGPPETDRGPPRS